jgi:hypothetical protein
MFSYETDFVMKFLTSINHVKFEVLEELAEGTVFWDVMPCSLVDAYRRFGKYFASSFMS